MLNVIGTDDVPNLVVAYQNQSATYQLGDGLVDMNSLVSDPKWGLSEEEQSDFFSGFYNADIFPSFDNARLGFPAQPLDGGALLQLGLAGRVGPRRPADNARGVR